MHGVIVVATVSATIATAVTNATRRQKPAFARHNDVIVTYTPKSKMYMDEEETLRQLLQQEIINCKFINM